MSGFDFGEIQNVVDDAEQMTARRLHGFRPTPLLRIEIAAQQHLVHAKHAVHRCADFMAHRGKKGGLRPIGSFGSFFGVLKICRARLHLFFQMVAMTRQAHVALLNLFKHQVEAARQRIQFLDLAGFGAQRVVAVFGHPTRKLLQIMQRIEQRGV